MKVISFLFPIAIRYITFANFIKKKDENFSETKNGANELGVRKNRTLCKDIEINLRFRRFRRLISQNMSIFVDSF